MVSDSNTRIASRVTNMTTFSIFCVTLFAQASHSLRPGHQPFLFRDILAAALVKNPFSMFLSKILNISTATYILYKFDIRPVIIVLTQALHVIEGTLH